MKREIINSDYEMRLVSLPAHAFWRLQSAAGEDVRGGEAGGGLFESLLAEAFEA